MATVTIHVGSNGWENRAKREIKKKNKVIFIIRGPEAIASKSLIDRHTGGHLTSKAIIAEDIMLVAILAAAAITGLVLAAVLTICIVGMATGYKVDVDYSTKKSWEIWDDVLKINLLPPAK